MLNDVPYECEYCYDGVCTNADSECRADYCPVIEYPEICKYAKEKQGNTMTPMQAWGIVSSNLMELYKLKYTNNFKGYTEADTMAEVICFKALQEMEERGADNG